MFTSRLRQNVPWNMASTAVLAFVLASGLFGCKGDADGIPPIVLPPPQGPGEVSGEHPHYETTLLLGASLDMTVEAIHNDGGAPFTLRIDHDGGSLTPEESGFNEQLPVEADGEYEAEAALTGTASRVGSVTLHVRAEDENGLHDELWLTVRTGPARIVSLESSLERVPVREQIEVSWELEGEPASLSFSPGGLDVTGQTETPHTPFTGLTALPLDPRTVYRLEANHPEFPDDVIAPGAVRKPVGNEARFVDVISRPDGSRVAVGTFENQVTFDAGGASQEQLLAGGDSDVMLAAFDADNEFLWARQVRSTAPVRTTGMAPLADGGFVVTGSFESATTFGPSEPNQRILNPQGLKDIYLARYDANGNLLSVHHAGGSGVDRVHGITSRLDGQIYIAGSFELSATFGDEELGETTLTTTSPRDLFVAAYRPSGELAWARQAGGDGEDGASALRVTPRGEIAVAGHFAETAVFGGGESGEVELTSSQDEDLFLATFTPFGDLKWVQPIETSDTARFTGLAALRNGSIALLGDHGGEVRLAPGEATETAFVAEGDRDGFMALFSHEGQLLWGHPLSGPGAIEAEAIGIEPDERAFVIAGTFDETMQLGEGAELRAGAEREVFAVRLETNEGELLSSLRLESGPESEVHQLAVTEASEVWLAGRHEAHPSLREIQPVNFRTHVVRPIDWGRIIADGGAETDTVRDVAVRPDGSYAVVGQFSDAVTFGEGEPGETTLISQGPSDIFVARYNIDSTLDWVNAVASDQGFDRASDVNVLSTGEIAIGGYLGASATFGQGEPNETQSVHDGAFSSFVALYAPDGTFQWVRSVNGPGDNVHDGMATRSDDSIVVTGSFTDEMTLGEGANTVTLNSPESPVPGFDYSSDVYVACFAADGELLWARSVEGDEEDAGGLFNSGHGVLVLSDDTVIVTGRFEGKAVFGPGELNETELESDGSYDIFLARYDTEGDLLWAQRAGGPEWCQGNALTLLPGGEDFVVGGLFRGSADFGEPGNQMSLTSAGGQDVFLARYSIDGEFAWVTRVGGPERNHLSKLVTRPGGDVVAHGHFEGTTTLGEGEPNETTMSAIAGSDLFLASFRPGSGMLNWARHDGGPQDNTAMGLAALIDGSLFVGGYFEDEITFGEGEPNESTFVSNGEEDFYLGRYFPE